MVDDEADTRELLRIGISQCGAETLTAGSAQEALKVLEKERPDLLISDIGMADEDGYELIRKVRALTGARGRENTGYCLDRICKNRGSHESAAGRLSDAYLQAGRAGRVGGRHSQPHSTKRRY